MPLLDPQDGISQQQSKSPFRLPKRLSGRNDYLLHRSAHFHTSVISETWNFPHISLL
jgi:hypothetical protein